MDRLEEKNLLSQLLDIYGGLLTDRQHEFMELHLNEDLSLGEIADNHEISRQAVHDAITNGRKSLEKFEKHLQILAKQTAEVPTGVSGTGNSEVNDLVREISHMVTEDLLYDTEPLKRKIEKLKGLLGID